MGVSTVGKATAGRATGATEPKQVVFSYWWQGPRNLVKLGKGRVGAGFLQGRRLLSGPAGVDRRNRGWGLAGRGPGRGL